MDNNVFYIKNTDGDNILHPEARRAIGRIIGQEMKKQFYSQYISYDLMQWLLGGMADTPDHQLPILSWTPGEQFLRHNGPKGWPCVLSSVPYGDWRIKAENAYRGQAGVDC